MVDLKLRGLETGSNLKNDERAQVALWCLLLVPTDCTVLFLPVTGLH